MDPDTISKSIKMVWEAFSAEPIPFLAGLALVGMVIFLGTRVFFRQQIVTLTAHREFAHDQAEAAKDAQKRLEVEIDRLQAEIDRLQAEIGGLKEAVKRDAAQRDHEVSPDVATAVSATESSIQNLKSSERELRNQLSRLTPITIDPTDWPFGPTGPLKGSDENEDKG